MKYKSKATMLSSAMVILVILLCLSLTGFCCADSEKSYGTEFNHESIVVFPVYAEEILLQMVEPNDVIFVGHKYWENASEYFPTMELTRDIPGDEYLNVDLHIRFNLISKPTIIIVDNDFKQGFECQYADIPEIADDKIKTIYVKSPESISDIIDLIMQLGQAVHKEKRAVQMIEQFNMEYERIIQAVSELQNNRPIRVMYYENFQESFPILAEICNIVNIFDGIEWVSSEDFGAASELNPDIVFYCPVLFGTDGSIEYVGKDYLELCYNYIKKDLFLQETNAIQNDQIYPLFLHQSQYILDDAWYVLSLLQNEIDPSPECNH